MEFSLTHQKTFTGYGTLSEKSSSLGITCTHAYSAFKKVSGFLGVLIMIGSTMKVSAQQTVSSYTGHTGGNWGSFQDIVRSLISFVNGKILPFIVLLTIVYFLWNLARFIRSMDQEKEREVFKKYSINALIGIFIMISLWGLVGILTGTFFGARPILPQLPTSDDYH